MGRITHCILCDRDGGEPPEVARQEPGLEVAWEAVWEVLLARAMG